jgi:hypothetical protein
MQGSVRSLLVLTTIVASAGHARAEAPSPELPALETSLADDGGSGTAELWVAAARSVAEMWATYVEQFGEGMNRMLTGVPWPRCSDWRIECPDWSDVVAQERQTTRGAFRTCVDYARILRYWDENAEACEAWLSAHHRGEFHRLDELRPAAHWSKPPRLTRQPPATYGAEH